MDITQLENFIMLAQHRSFSRAARHLNLTQSGLSRQVQKLESEVGASLLKREHLAVELTAAGQSFLIYAQDAVSQYKAMLMTLRQAPPILAGELRIAASTTPGEFLVPDLVARFTADHPEVRPQVFITDSAQVIEELKEGRWDIGFVGAKLPGRAITYDVIAEDEVVLAVPLVHPFAGRREIQIEELADQPFVEREGGSGTLRSVRTTLAKSDISLPAYRVTMVLSTTRAVLSAVGRGYGLGWASNMALESDLTERVAVVRLSGLPIYRSLYMIRDRGRLLDPVASAFMEWVRQQGLIRPR